ncbi:MAG TPA: transposase [Alphaproteobacteria bacterium]|nr:transposase [Alphaproteobacteria bacterium]
MSLTENTTPRPASMPAPAATAGIDWAKDDYAVCVVDADGEVVQRATLTYTKTGLSRLIGLITEHGVNGVGIERPDGLLRASIHAPTTSCSAEVHALQRFSCSVRVCLVRTDDPLRTNPGRFDSAGQHLPGQNRLARRTPNHLSWGVHGLRPRAWCIRDRSGSLVSP